MGTGKGLGLNRQAAGGEQLPAPSGSITQGACRGNGQVTKLFLCDTSQAPEPKQFDI